MTKEKTQVALIMTVAVLCVVTGLWLNARATNQECVECEMLKDKALFLQVAKEECEDRGDRIAILGDALQSVGKKLSLTQATLSVFWYAVGNDLGWDIYSDIAEHTGNEDFLGKGHNLQHFTYLKNCE